MSLNISQMLTLAHVCWH